MRWRPIKNKAGVQGQRSDPEESLYFEVVQHGDSEWHVYLYIEDDAGLVPCLDLQERLGLTFPVAEEIRFWYCRVYPELVPARAACRRIIAIIQEVIREAGDAT